MNALCYKIVFSKRLGTLVAVGEHTTGQGKTASGTGVRSTVGPQYTFGNGADYFVGSLKSIFACAALTVLTAGTSLAAPAVNALPSGYTVNSGNVSISTSGAAMTIKQATDKASLNWSSFSVGQDASVNIIQNSSRSVLLNRVVGQDPSQIFGKISANGQIILINPNGIVFGKNGSVTASSFTASTFNLTDDDFANGNYNFKRDGSKAGVTNQGAIVATEEGGYIALIGANVTNEGSIKTVKGAVVMAAGDSVALPSAMTSNIQVPLSSKVRLELLPSTINAMVANTESGVITTDGGQVLMHAAAVSDAVANISANVVNSGRIDTTGVQGGAVTLRADDGYIKVDGAITANSTGKDSNNQQRKGADIIIGRDEVTGVLAKATDVSGAKLESKQGFVETSAHNLATDGVQVKAGTWLLDPDNIDITGDNTSAKAGYSKIKASDIAKALNAGTSVTVSTTSGVSTRAVPYTANNPNSDGNIEVNAAIVKQAVNGVGNDSTLSLIADNGITINQRIGKASGDATGSAGKLDVTMLANGNANSAADSLGITLNNIIDANGGKVTLTGTSRNSGAYVWAQDNSSKSGVVFNQNSGIIAASYEVTGTQLTNTGSGVSGVIFKGNNVTLTSTTGASFVSGIKNGVDNLYASGLRFSNGSGVNINSGSGTSTISGSSFRVVDTLGGTADITTNGDVTLGRSDKSFSDRASNIQVQSGKFTILGSSIELYNGDAGVTAKDNTTVTLKSAGNLNLSLLGESGGTFAFGKNSTVNLEAGNAINAFRSVTTGSGSTVNITAGSANLYGGQYAPAPMTVSADTINITADNLSTSNSYSTTKLNAGNTLTIANKTANTAINIGGSDASGTMGISQTELSQMSAPNLIIGRLDKTNSTPKTGDITVSTTIDATNVGNVTLQTASNININGNLTAGKDNANSNLTFDAFGNISINANVAKKGTGNVVIAAGSNEIAGTRTGGQVKTTSGKSVSNPLGKTYIYSGSASATGVLSYLDVSLSSLNITGNSNQNTDTFVAYDQNSLGISGSTANAQVMFREQISVNSTDLVGTTVTQTYGDDITAQTANNALLSSVKSKLITENNRSGSTITVGDQSNNKITLSKSVVINSLNGELSGSYSSTNFLNANSTGYQYTTGLKSDKYTTSIAASDVKVFVDQAKLTKLTAAKTYDGLYTVSADQMGIIEGVRGETFNAASGTADISNKNVLGSNAITDLSKLTLAGVRGSDTSNYKFDNSSLPQETNNTVTITAKTITLSSDGVTAKTYDGTLTATLNGSTLVGSAAAGSSTDGKIVAGDNVKLNTTDLQGTYADKNVRGTDGNGANTVSVTGATLTKIDAAGNDDASNYTLASTGTVAANNTITAKTITLSSDGVTAKTYDGTLTATLNGSTLVGSAAAGSSTDGKIVAGDNVKLNTTDLQGTYADKNVRGTDGNGANTVSVTGATLTKIDATGNDDASNYTLASTGTVAANNTITKTNLVISGSREYDGTTVVNGNTLVATGVTVGTRTESFAVVGAGDSSNLSSKNVLQNNGTTLNNLTGLGLGSGINGADAGNYNFVANNSSYTITQNTSANVALTASANTTYNGTTQNIAGAVQANGLVGNDTAANIGVTATLSGKNAGTSTDTTYLQDTNYTNLLANYKNVAPGNGTLTIQKASLTNVTGYKAFDGTNNIDAANLVLKGVNGEEFTTTTAGIAASNDPKAAKNYVTNVSSLSLTAKNNASVELLSNYDLTKLPTNNQVIFNSTTVKPVVLPRTPNTAATKPASSVRATIGNANGFELASAEDGSEGEEFCSADHVDMNHCDCVESSVSNGVFLCVTTTSTQKVASTRRN